MTAKPLLYLFIFALFGFSFSVSVKEKILLNAQANIGETAWAKDVDRQAKRNDEVYVLKGEWKCNLFVYEIILASGYDIGTPNSVNCWNPKYYDICLKKKTKRPPCCKDWFDETVPGFYLIGTDDEGRKISEKGDIITDGIHVGIISIPKDGYTISAAEKEVVETQFGFSESDKTEKTFKIFRYNGDNLNGLIKSKLPESKGKNINISIILFMIFMLLI